MIIENINQLNDAREKQKLFEEFPIFGAKQKCLIRGKNYNSTYIMVVLKGEVVVKYQGGGSNGGSSNNINIHSNSNSNNIHNNSNNSNSNVSKK